MVLARERRFWLQMRMRNTARLVTELRGHLQPERGQEDEWAADTKKLSLEIAAKTIAYQKRKIENAARWSIGLANLKQPDQHEHVLSRMAFVQKTARPLAEWSLEEDAVLKRMTEAAATLPFASFCEHEDRKGFTLAGMAVLIGHAGHPLDYANVGKLWKRLGLAPYEKDGVVRAGSTWSLFGGLTKTDWIALGYKRSRLGDVTGKITQPLLYAQWRKEGATLRYGVAYGRYKERQVALNNDGAFQDEAERQAASMRKAGRKPGPALAAGKLPDIAIHRRALRYMTKLLVKDLWHECRRSAPGQNL
jgi:hypothetical protein